MTHVGRRRRLGVALILDPPAAAEVDGLRRALGDPGVGRIPPHLTLVAPVNVRAAALPEALAVLRRAASRLPGPLTLTLGPPATFRPDSPVVYLGVGGDLRGLRILRDALQEPPLLRQQTWPWVPHVTIADEMDDARIDATLLALGRYAAVTSVDRVVMLEESTVHQWHPVADAALGAPVVVGRGGLALELTFGRLVDLEGWEMLRAREVPVVAPGASARGKIVATARREGRVVAVGAAWLEDDGGHVAVFVDPDHRRQGVGSVVLAQLESAVSRAGWDAAWLAATGPAAFYRARSSYSKATEE